MRVPPILAKTYLIVLSILERSLLSGYSAERRLTAIRVLILYGIRRRRQYGVLSSDGSYAEKKFEKNIINNIYIAELFPPNYRVACVCEYRRRQTSIQLVIVRGRLRRSCGLPCGSSRIITAIVTNCRKLIMNSISYPKRLISGRSHRKKKADQTIRGPKGCTERKKTKVNK